MHFMLPFCFTPLTPLQRKLDTKEEQLACIFVGDTQVFTLYFTYKVIDSSIQIHSSVGHGTYVVYMLAKFGD